jgi:hypothetical protein
LALSLGWVELLFEPLPQSCLALYRDLIAEVLRSPAVRSIPIATVARGQ